MEKMTRRESRENAFKVLFAKTFEREDDAAFQLDIDGCELDEFGVALLNGYANHTQQIDEMIEANLKGWTFNRVPRVSVSIVRLAISEMLFGPEKKVSVAINEAVELTKKFGGEAEYQFVNGILGAIASSLPQDDASDMAMETGASV